MGELDPVLLRRLRELRVEVEQLEADMIVLRSVPSDPQRFSKARTSLLVKRTRPGMPCLIGVDEDLEYRGADAALLRLFASAHRQQGWRLFFLQGDSWPEAVERALLLLGNVSAGSLERSAVPSPSPVGGGLLDAFGEDLSSLTRESPGPPTVGRGELIERVCVSLSCWRPRLALIVGESGVGKTNLLYAVARRLGRRRPALRLVRVHLSALMAGAWVESERENLLRSVLAEAAGDSSLALALESLEQAVANTPSGCSLLADALEKGVRLAGVVLPEFAGLFEAAPLRRHVDWIEASPLEAESAREALEAWRESIARHHGVHIDQSLMAAVLDRSLSLAGCLPDKAIALLDAAAARAALSGARQLDLYHIYAAGADFREA